MSYIYFNIIPCDFISIRYVCAQHSSGPRMCGHCMSPEPGVPIVYREDNAHLPTGFAGSSVSTVDVSCTHLSALLGLQFPAFKPCPVQSWARSLLCCRNSCQSVCRIAALSWDVNGNVCLPFCTSMSCLPPLLHTLAARHAGACIATKFWWPSRILIRMELFDMYETHILVLKIRFAA